MNHICWVTGASGFIGHRLLNRLAAHGYAVGGLDRMVPSLPQPGHSVTAPLGQPALDQLATLTGLPDVVFHLAGGSAVGPSFEDPLEDFNRAVPPTAVLIDWLSRNAPGARVLFASSAAVYGNRHRGPIPEHADLVPSSPYGVHKAVCEQLLSGAQRISGLDAVIVRIFSVYGAGLRKQVLYDSCMQLLRSPRLVLGGTGGEVRHFIACEDLLPVLTTAMERAASGQVINVAAGAPVRMEQLADVICAAWQHATGRCCTYEFTGSTRPGDPFALVAEQSWLAANCPWPPKPLPKGVLSYVEWFLDNVASASPKPLAAVQ
jgi:UDP-glucose 4-epimerase